MKEIKLTKLSDKKLSLIKGGIEPNVVRGENVSITSVNCDCYSVCGPGDATSVRGLGSNILANMHSVLNEI